jgi:glutamate-1-semialdehyde 2,1-aminomutase
MAFKNFFGKSKDAATPAPRKTEDAALDATDAEDIGAEEVDDAEMPEAAPQRSWRERAEAVLPTGASTGSKRAAALFGRDAVDAPMHFVRARGCRLTDVSGREYVDCTMALGAVALGYGAERVTAAVIEAVNEGNVSALSSWREVELAEALCAVIPCAERVQFLKTGAEATSAAVRLARTYTGRDRIVASGYFGWHDWSSDAAGVPASTRALASRVPFDDVPALERAVAEAGSDLAAIVLEPVVDREPSEAWLATARELCDTTGAALIFDEVKTGFRVETGGWQQRCGITPDLASFGKAMANGYPLAAVVGLAPLMEAARKTWISSTLASESVALAAGIAVQSYHEELDVCAELAATGRDMRLGVDNAIAASGVTGVNTEGSDAMWLLRWDDPARETRFLLLALEAGVIFKRGAYNFAALAHDAKALQLIEAAASSALVALREEERG